MKLFSLPTLTSLSVYTVLKWQCNGNGNRYVSALCCTPEENGLSGCWVDWDRPV